MSFVSMYLRPIGVYFFLFYFYVVEFGWCLFVVFWWKVVDKRLINGHKVFGYLTVKTILKAERKEISININIDLQNHLIKLNKLMSFFRVKIEFSPHIIC